jgi:elongation factor Ts
MANFTAADVKKLRELTGAGMLDCKNALADSDGDFDKAVEALRIKGAKDVGKRAERATAEGLVAARGGALIELNSETDFVAKNAEFQQLADDIVAAAANSKAADVDALKAAVIAGGQATTTVEQAIADLSAKIGEKLELRRVAFFDGTVEAYLHKRAADLPPAVGVLVEFEGADSGAAHSVALQIAALKARYLTRADVPEDVVSGERRIAEETAKAEGKPEQALPKIVEGRLNGFFKDAVLLEQPSVSDSKKTVKALLDEAGVTVTRFARFEVGQA